VGGREEGGKEKKTRDKRVEEPTYYIFTFSNTMLPPALITTAALGV
jgi:hypothetical protein